MSTEDPGRRQPGKPAPHPQFGNFREVFRRHASGVAIITAQHGDRPAGFTATSLASLSADPPALSFNLARTSSSWPVVQNAPYVGIHVLGEENRALADRFATHAADRFGGDHWRTGPHGVPVLKDVQGWLIAKVVDTVSVGGTVIVIGEVVDGGYLEGDAPLLYHRGRYVRSAPIEYEI